MSLVGYTKHVRAKPRGSAHASPTACQLARQLQSLLRAVRHGKLDEQPFGGETEWFDRQGKVLAGSDADWNERRGF